MACFSVVALISRGAAENWNNGYQGHAKELFFLAPCTVEEARRDAGLLPFGYSPNGELTKRPLREIVQFILELCSKPC